MLFGIEVKVFGHFVQERGGFDVGEVEDSESIDSIVK
jgi:hypothetical protein